MSLRHEGGRGCHGCFQITTIKTGEEGVGTATGCCTEKYRRSTYNGVNNLGVAYMGVAVCVHNLKRKR